MPAATPELHPTASQRLVAELFGAAEPPALARLAVARAAGDTGVAVSAAEVAALITSGLAGRDEDDPVRPFVVAETAQAGAADRGHPASSLQPPAAPPGAWLSDRRTWRHERDLAVELTRRAASALPAEPMPETAALAAAFPDHPAARAIGGVDWQRRAAEVALARGLTLITGGPGCGKTTVAARVVALLAGARRAAGLPPPVVVLAAPTGKAAARLAEAVRDGLRGQGLDAAAAGVLAGWTSTLHRLFHDRRADDIEVAVIDEASMADAAGLARVLARIPRQARVLLLGDPDQLASVEPGRVLGDLAALPERHPITAAAVRLRVNWRSGRAPALAALVRALQEGEPDAAGLLAAGTTAGETWIARADLPPSPEAAVEALLTAHAGWLAELRGAADPAAALRVADQLRLLAVLRSGPWGADQLNALWEDGLRARGWAAAGRDYHGRLVLITRNRPDLALANGDIGVCWSDPDGVLRLHVAAVEGTRALPLHRLDATVPAWFLTVHKAQGGQGAQVEVVGLPRGASEGQRRLATREMVYTAITRASARLRVWWDADGLREALARRELERRRSGFAAHLRRAG